jgi:hypothetical protein
VDSQRFDALARSLVLGASRRALAGGLAAALLGSAGFDPIADAGARKRKQLERNKYGCVNVGNPCGGRDRVCCSGICKGKKDRSRCAAHGADVCRRGHHLPACGATNDVTCTTSTGASGLCATTTGNAGFCAQGFICQVCSRDRECQPSPDPSAACIRCGSCPSGTACAVP